MRRKPKNNLRSGPKRESYQRALIVCEGSKTEPQYLKELAGVRKLSTANIVIDGKCDSSPISVANYAFKEFDKEKSRGGAYDKVFCVFDKDSHTSYEQALNVIRRKRPSGVFRAIVSVPCFEYWILLHYVYTAQPYQKTGAKSPCGNVIESLKQHITEYEKGSRQLYTKLLPKLEVAYINAATARRSAISSNTDNPTTEMDILVKYLHSLKDS